MNAVQGVQNGLVTRILIVDDNADAAETTGMWLELTGHQVETVTDSSKCWSRLEAFCPDAVLLDITMPGISGYELAKKIRAQSKFEKLTIVAVSGYADGEHAQRSIDVGCDRHLVKPVDLNVLVEVIADEVEKRLKLPTELVKQQQT
jgi:two-component system, chemotaxis family, CheB/CheR fusion protein